MVTMANTIVAKVTFLEVTAPICHDYVCYTCQCAAVGVKHTRNYSDLCPKPLYTVRHL